MANQTSMTMQQKTYSPNRLATAIIVAITVIGVVLVASDWQKMRSVLAEADWRYLPIVLGLTFFSYGFYSYGFAVVAQMLEIQMRKLELAEVCFISTVVNHVLTAGGVVGYSLRYLLMSMYKVTFKDVVSASIIHVYLTSLDMLTILPLSFVYLLMHATVPQGAAIALGFMTVVFIVVLVLTTGFVLFQSVRRPVIKLLAFLGKKIIRRDYDAWFTQLDETMTRGGLAIRQRPSLLLFIMVLTFADFVCSIAAMGFIFRALGTTVSPAVLVTGYVIGIMAGLLSMVPGGFGIQEASMAGIYALLGVPFEVAVLAAILFRVLYYLVPYFCILPFYNRLRHRASQQVANES